MIEIVNLAYGFVFALSSRISFRSLRETVRHFRMNGRAGAKTSIWPKLAVVEQQAPSLSLS